MDKMLYMGVYGSILIAAAICFRHFFSHRVPKRLMVFLWICAIARLLVPVFIPVSWHPQGWRDVPALSCIRQADDSSSDHLRQLDNKTAGADLGRAQNAGRTVQAADQDLTGAAQETGAAPARSVLTRLAAPAVLAASALSRALTVPADAVISAVSAALAEHGCLRKVLVIVWLSAAVSLALRILIMHMRSCRIYSMSLPASGQRTNRWLKAHHSMRRVDVRESEFVKSPLTYGVIHPVILLPLGLELDEKAFACIMEHEWVHIKRWDILVKYILYLTVCIYWFHPLVWVMAVLLNRDMEMACDEEVIRMQSSSLKAAYAEILIRLAQGRRDTVWPVSACFARQSELEERIRFIMGIKKYSRKAAALAAGIICCTIVTFTVSAKETPEGAGSAAQGIWQKEAGSMSGAAVQDPVSSETDAELRAADGMHGAAGQDSSASNKADAELKAEDIISDEADAELKAADDVSGGAGQGRNQTDAAPETADGVDKGTKPVQITEGINGESGRSENRLATEKAYEETEYKQAGRAGRAAEEAQRPAQSAGLNAAGQEPAQSAGLNAAGQEPDAADRHIAELARKYIGAPYQFGGTDLSSGVDSAGFVKAVYALAGYDVPADLQELSACGNKVSLEEIKAGDIVIYSNGEESSETGYAHAAIYDGSGQVIHASNMRDGVKVSDLNYREIAAAIRIL